MSNTENKLKDGNGSDASTCYPLNFMDLNRREVAWLKRLKKTADAAPAGLSKKIGAFTVGDAGIVIYDKQVKDEYEESLAGWDTREEHEIVLASGAWCDRIWFPFNIDSTSG